MQLPSPVGFSICSKRGWHLLDAHVSCLISGNALADGIGSEFNSITISCKGHLIELKCTATSEPKVNVNGTESVDTTDSTTVTCDCFTLFVEVTF